MADLILLYFENEDPVRCIDLDDAKSRVKERGSFLEKAILKITPEGGGIVRSLEFDSQSNEWVPTTIER